MYYFVALNQENVFEHYKKDIFFFIFLNALIHPDGNWTQVISQYKYLAENELKTHMW